MTLHLPLTHFVAMCVNMYMTVHKNITYSRTQLNITGAILFCHYFEQSNYLHKGHYGANKPNKKLAVNDVVSKCSLIKWQCDIHRYIAVVWWSICKDKASDTMLFLHCKLKQTHHQTPDVRRSPRWGW